MDTTWLSVLMASCETMVNAVKVSQGALMYLDGLVVVPHGVLLDLLLKNIVGLRHLDARRRCLRHVTIASSAWSHTNLVSHVVACGVALVELRAVRLVDTNQHHACNGY